MGVKLSIDDGPQGDVTTGWQLRLDARAHELTFTCEVCSSKQVAVGPGDKDDTLRVSLPIKPATLIVQGDVEKTYQIVDEPQLVIRAGSNSIALKSMYRAITVQQMETGMWRRVRLQAGKAIPVAF
jgi:hypothetical protein